LRIKVKIFLVEYNRFLGGSNLKSFKIKRELFFGFAAKLGMCD